MPPHADVLQWEHLPFPFNRRFYPFNAFRSLLGVGTRMFESETESNRKMAEQIAAHNAARKKAR